MQTECKRSHGLYPTVGRDHLEAPIWNAADMAALAQIYSGGDDALAQALLPKTKLLCELHAAALDPIVRRRIKKYGIGIEEYVRMLRDQDGLCAICRQSAWTVRQRDGCGLNVDHCHESGKVRGLLCRRCNTGLGQLGDTLQRVTRALQYLQRAAGQPS